MVDIEASSQAGSFSGTDILNLIAESSSSSADLLYVLPPLALFAVGAFLAMRWDVTALDEAVIAGAPVTIGYVVIMGPVRSSPKPPPNGPHSESRPPARSGRHSCPRSCSAAYCTR